MRLGVRTAAGTAHSHAAAARLLTISFAAVLVCAALYVLASYIVIPQLWRVHERRHPALDSVPTHTTTRDGIPGDPVNVSVVATEEELQLLMRKARWSPADAKTLRSALRIAADTLARRPYDLAPVSDLYLWGRRQDLAFEQPVGHDPRRRHHVRFWRSTELDASGRPLWAGAATYDIRAGVSHRTGQITHHIAPRVDDERDELLSDLQRTGDGDVTWIDGFQQEHEGRNGGGDPYVTDGRLAVVRYRDHASLRERAPARAGSPME